MIARHRIKTSPCLCVHCIFSFSPAYNFVETILKKGNYPMISFRYCLMGDRSIINKMWTRNVNLFRAIVGPIYTRHHGFYALASEWLGVGFLVSFELFDGNRRFLFYHDKLIPSSARNYFVAVAWAYILGTVELSNNNLVRCVTWELASVWGKQGVWYSLASKLSNG